jgi:hypothetical protein
MLINSIKTACLILTLQLVHPNGKWLLNANYTESSLSVYRITEMGQNDIAVQREHSFLLLSNGFD